MKKKDKGALKNKVHQLGNIAEEIDLIADECDEKESEKGEKRSDMMDDLNTTLNKCNQHWLILLIN